MELFEVAGAVARHKADHEFELIGERSGWEYPVRRYLTMARHPVHPYASHWFIREERGPHRPGETDYLLAENGLDGSILFAGTRRFAYINHTNAAPVLVHPEVWRKLGKTFNPRDVLIRT